MQQYLCHRVVSKNQASTTDFVVKQTILAVPDLYAATRSDFLDNKIEWLISRILECKEQLIIKLEISDICTICSYDARQITGNFCSQVISMAHEQKFKLFMLSFLILPITRPRLRRVLTFSTYESHSSLIMI